jgi:hypothetical protein
MHEESVTFEGTELARKKYEEDRAREFEAWRSQWKDIGCCFAFTPFRWAIGAGRERLEGLIWFDLGPIRGNVLLPWMRDREGGV